MKSKEPLLAVLVSILFPGLGQIYAGFLNRGIFLATISVILMIGCWILVTQYLLKIFISAFDSTGSTSLLSLIWIVVVFFIIVLFGLFVLIDAHRCANKWNTQRNLERRVTGGKKFLLIAGILFLILGFNPPVAIWELTIPQEVKAQLQSVKQFKNNFEAFKINSQSMASTLSKGDRVLADKMIYKRSLPQRGDVIVFRDPQGSGRSFIQRLIAVGGESILIRDGHIFIDGQMLEHPEIQNRHYYNRGQYGQIDESVTVPKGQYFFWEIIALPVMTVDLLVSSHRRMSSARFIKSIGRYKDRAQWNNEPM